MGPDTENDHTSGSRDAKPKVGTGHVFEVGYVPHERDAAQADAAQADATGDAGREETKASAGTPPFPGASSPAAKSGEKKPLSEAERRHRRRTRIVAVAIAAVVALLGGRVCRRFAQRAGRPRGGGRAQEGCGEAAPGVAGEGHPHARRVRLEPQQGVHVHDGRRRDLRDRVQPHLGRVA